MWALAHALSGDEGVAGARLDESEQHLQRGRLAGAVRAEEPEDLAGPNLEREIGDGAHTFRPEAHAIIHLLESCSADDCLRTASQNRDRRDA